jgi:hypothetical protein
MTCRWTEAERAITSTVAAGHTSENLGFAPCRRVWRRPTARASSEHCASLALLHTKTWPAPARSDCGRGLKTSSAAAHCCRTVLRFDCPLSYLQTLSRARVRNGAHSSCRSKVTAQPRESAKERSGTASQHTHNTSHALSQGVGWCTLIKDTVVALPARASALYLTERGEAGERGRQAAQRCLGRGLQQCSGGG